MCVVVLYVLRGISAQVSKGPYDLMSSEGSTLNNARAIKVKALLWMIGRLKFNKRIALS